MVDEPTQEAKASVFAQQTPHLIRRLDNTMTEFSKENEGINPLAAVAALTYVLCHAAFASGMSRDALVLGLAANYDVMAEAMDTEGRTLQ